MRSSRRDFLRVIGSGSVAAVAHPLLRGAAGSGAISDGGVQADPAARAHEARGIPIAPVDLLVNGVSNPLAIDRDKVWFTWRSNDAAREAVQSAYQILVSSSRERLSGDAGDFWDSGKVDSD